MGRRVPEQVPAVLVAHVAHIMCPIERFLAVVTFFRPEAWTVNREESTPRMSRKAGAQQGFHVACRGNCPRNTGAKVAIGTEWRNPGASLSAGLPLNRNTMAPTMPSRLSPRWRLELPAELPVQPPAAEHRPDDDAHHLQPERAEAEVVLVAALALSSSSSASCSCPAVAAHHAHEACRAETQIGQVEGAEGDRHREHHPRGSTRTSTTRSTRETSIWITSPAMNRCWKSIGRPSRTAFLPAVQQQAGQAEADQDAQVYGADRGHRRASGAPQQCAHGRGEQQQGQQERTRRRGHDGTKGISGCLGAGAGIVVPAAFLTSGAQAHGSISFTTPPPMLQLPVNTAPARWRAVWCGCRTGSWPWPSGSAGPGRRSLPETVPSMSELWQCTSPLDHAGLSHDQPTAGRGWCPSPCRRCAGCCPSGSRPRWRCLHDGIDLARVHRFGGLVHEVGLLSLRNTIVDDEGGAVQCAKITGSGTYPIAPAGSSW